MATITEETGTGASNSTSYATEAELTAYIAERGITLSNTNGTNSELLIKAMDYLEQQNFIGDKGSSTQALQWPRVNVIVDGWNVASDSIPTILKEIQIEFAAGIDEGNNPMNPVSRETLKEKVGDIEVEYSSSSRSQTYVKAAELKLNKLLKNSGGLSALRV